MLLAIFDNPQCILRESWCVLTQKTPQLLISQLVYGLHVSNIYLRISC